MTQIPEHTGYTQDWTTQVVPVFKKLLSPLKGLSRLQFLEVGCWEGRSTVWLLENILTHSDSHIWCVDLWDGFPDSRNKKKRTEWTGERFINNTNKHKDKIRLLFGPSCNALRNIAHKPFDFIYLDGSHRGKDVLTDMVLAWPLLRVDHVMLIDDYEEGRQTEPKEAVDAFIKEFKDELEIAHKGREIALRRVKCSN